ncbi:MAG: preprotein translocase subunit YajC [Prevotellaceae bacterium]|nr:preprotein translocase subunit YajC [Candidatus Colivivens equi]MCQ2075527.1 preprotein translocase subunit YajC [Bacteroidaceae bacterium]
MNLQILQAGGATTGGMDMSFWIMIIAMFAILYFFMIRPQNKRRKELQNFRNSLQVGSKVITAGGILGTVKDLNEGETFITIEIANSVKIQIDRNYVFSDTNAVKPQ